MKKANNTIIEKSKNQKVKLFRDLRKSTRLYIKQFYDWELMSSSYIMKVAKEYERGL